MRLSKILAPVMLAGLFAANAAHAKQATTFAFTDPLPTFTYTAETAAGLVTAASDIRYQSGNIPGQSVADMQTQIQTLFSLTDSSLLKAVSSCDGVGNCSATSPSSATFTKTGSGKATEYVFSSTGSFDYLAMHLGGGELAFHWSTAVSKFSITGLTNGSNVRAYTNLPNVPAVPEPETYAMMLAGMLGIAGLRLRKRGA